MPDLRMDPPVPRGTQPGSTTVHDETKTMTTRDRYGETIDEPTGEIIPLRPGEPDPVTPTEAGLAWLRSIRDQLLAATSARP